MMRLDKTEKVFKSKEGLHLSCYTTSAKGDFFFAVEDRNNKQSLIKKYALISPGY